MSGSRLVRYVGAAVCAALVAAALPAVVVADDFDGDPLEKVAEEIEKLREKGDWAKSGKLSEQLAACNDAPYEQPFLSWGDSADYVPVPGGDIEDLAGWQLDKDVQRVHAGGDAALLLSEGEEIVTAPMCITVDHPTLRFFAAN